MPILCHWIYNKSEAQTIKTQYINLEIENYIIIKKELKIAWINHKKDWWFLKAWQFSHSHIEGQDILSISERYEWLTEPEAGHKE